MLLRLCLHSRLDDEHALTRALEEALGLRWRPAFDLASALLLGRSVPCRSESPRLDALAAAGVDAEPLASWPALRAPGPEALEALERAWQALRAELERLAPEALAGLGGPAWPDDLEALEAALGRAVPDEWLAFLARHDGGRLNEWELAPLAAVEDTWRFLTQAHAAPSPGAERAAADPGIRPSWWRPGWVPFAGNGAGDHLCLDLDPGPGGAVGQVIEFRHDDGRRPLIARGFAAWLSDTAAALQEGALVATEELDGSFAFLLFRSSLTGSLASLRVRGEPESSREARLADWLADPAELAGELLLRLRKAGLIELRQEAFAPVHVLPALTEALDQAGPDSQLAWLALATLRTLDDVERLSARPDQVVALLRELRAGR